MNNTLKRPVCIKLDVAGNEAVLAETQHRFNEAASWVASLCWEERISNTNTAHHRVYTYKAAQAGVPIYLVDPASTSQLCSRCGYTDPANRQSQFSFRCRRCGFSCHADSNTAMNIQEAGSQAAYGSSGTSPATSPSRSRDVGT